VHDNALASVDVESSWSIAAIRGGRGYKTRNNSAHETTFEGAARAGGVDDAELRDEHFNIIADDNNLFDNKVYRSPDKRARALRVGSYDVRLGRAAPQR
jgi:hypothetical protein